MEVVLWCFRKEQFGVARRASRATKPQINGGEGGRRTEKGITGFKRAHGHTLQRKRKILISYYPIRHGVKDVMGLNHYESIPNGARQDHSRGSIE